MTNFLSGMDQIQGTGDSNEGDPELKKFLRTEQEKAKIQGQIHEFSNICWDKCMDKPENKLDSNTQTCIENCMTEKNSADKTIEQ